MAISARCDKCLKPVEIEYWYDRVIIHRCPCKGNIVIEVPQGAPPVTANSI